ncbi:PhzF family phenazine biosynthesis protein [Haloferacaceae archaeon DSL9]
MPPADSTRRVCLVDAFTDEPLAGNAAGVVPDAEGLADEQMQAIARELAASETAFFFPSEAADRKIRYFTPTQEVDLCGHATVAGHALLFEDGALDAGSHTLETNVGVLDIDVDADGTVWMTQAEPVVETVEVDLADVAAALGIDEAALDAVSDDLPIARASTGLPFLVVPVAFLESLGDCQPRMDAVEALSATHDVAGLYVFTFDTLRADSTLHARMFAPAAGVPEDPVTGTASCACGAYLRAVDAFETFPEGMRFEQGDFIDRGGIASVRVGDVVRVGGRATTALDGSLRIPDRSEDAILEP